MKVSYLLEVALVCEYTGLSNIMIKERATYLLEVYQNGKLSDSEKLELIAIIEEGGADLEPALVELIEIIDKGRFEADETRKLQIYQHIEAKIAEELSVTAKP